jgi:hypothetical protein
MGGVNPAPILGVALNPSNAVTARADYEGHRYPVVDFLEFQRAKTPAVRSILEECVHISRRSFAARFDPLARFPALRPR